MKKYPHGSQMPKKIILPTLTLALFMSLSSCDFSNKKEKDEKHTPITVVLDTVQDIENDEEYNFNDQIEKLKKNGIIFPEKIKKNQVRYHYKYGNHHIQIIFENKGEKLQTKDIIQNDNKNLGRKQKQKIKDLQNREYKRDSLNLAIQEILNKLIGKQRATANKNTLDLTEYYLNGGTSETERKKIRQEQENLEKEEESNKKLTTQEINTLLSGDDFSRNEEKNAVEFSYSLNASEKGDHNGIPLGTDAKLSIQQYGEKIKMTIVIYRTKHNLDIARKADFEQTYIFEGDTSAEAISERLTDKYQEGFYDEKNNIISKTNDYPTLGNIKEKVDRAVEILKKKLGI